MVVVCGGDSERTREKGTGREGTGGQKFGPPVGSITRWSVLKIQRSKTLSDEFSVPMAVVVSRGLATTVEETGGAGVIFLSGDSFCRRVFSGNRFSGAARICYFPVSSLLSYFFYDSFLFFSDDDIVAVDNEDDGDTNTEVRLRWVSRLW
ncbi:hypothetical protein HanRHA438_Chr02g0068141 [Helianthus annuus]|nr:hypothetical protein HanRHA438_Chr02g0068141 [Helianthus annuus]